MRAVFLLGSVLQGLGIAAVVLQIAVVQAKPRFEAIGLIRLPDFGPDDIPVYKRLLQRDDDLMPPSIKQEIERRLDILAHPPNNLADRIADIRRLGGLVLGGGAVLSLVGLALVTWATLPPA